MITRISDAKDYLLSLRKTTKSITVGNTIYYEVDGRKYTAEEYLEFANSTNPATWLRS